MILKGEKDDDEKIERDFKELIFILNKNGHLTKNDVNIVFDLVKLDCDDLTSPHRRKKHTAEGVADPSLFQLEVPSIF